MKEDEDIIFLKRLEIDGIPSVIFKENRYNGGNTTTILLVSIGSGEQKNRLLAYNTTESEDELIIKIFQNAQISAS